MSRSALSNWYTKRAVVRLARILADNRYMPPGGPTDVYWSPEVDVTRYPFQQQPGGAPPVKSEKDRIMPHPERDYQVENVFEYLPFAEMERIPPAALMEDVAPIAQDKSDEELKLEIRTILGAVDSNERAKIESMGIGVPDFQMQKPYLLDMTYQYLARKEEATRDDPEQKQLHDQLVKKLDPKLMGSIGDWSSRSRFPIKNRNIVTMMLDLMNRNELEEYWNSIVNFGFLPYGSPMWTVLRFGGGLLGSTFDQQRQETWDTPFEDFRVNLGTHEEYAKYVDWWKDEIGETYPDAREAYGGMNGLLLQYRSGEIPFEEFQQRSEEILEQYKAKEVAPQGEG